MLEIHLNRQAIDDALENLQQATGNLAPALKNIGEALLKSIDRRFSTQTAPDGSSWARNSPTTIVRKGRDMPLIGESSALRMQNTYQLDGQRLIVGNTMAYAAMQQFGGKKSQFPHLWGDIPARPFIGLSAEDEEIVVEIITDHLQRATQAS